MSLPEFGELYVTDVDSLRCCCGVDEIGGFNYDPSASFDFQCPSSYKLGEPSGTGMFVSTFIDNTDCRVAYEYLTSEHKLLFQSQPYRNLSSNNKVFLCVFLHKDVANKGKARRGEKLPKL